jgi:hypothetical protein
MKEVHLVCQGERGEGLHPMHAFEERGAAVQFCREWAEREASYTDHKPEQWDDHTWFVRPDVFKVITIEVK